MSTQQNGVKVDGERSKLSRSRNCWASTTDHVYEIKNNCVAYYNQEDRGLQYNVQIADVEQSREIELTETC